MLQPVDLPEFSVNLSPMSSIRHTHNSTLPHFFKALVKSHALVCVDKLSSHVRLSYRATVKRVLGNYIYSDKLDTTHHMSRLMFIKTMTHCHGNLQSTMAISGLMLAAWMSGPMTTGRYWTKA